MPELPEVEVVRRGLESHAVGRTIEAVEVLHTRPVRRDPGGPTGFVASLTGRAISPTAIADSISHITVKDRP